VHPWPAATELSHDPWSTTSSRPETNHP
jgi:hypothetical protein